jgi:3-oxoacyl-[acyl-carrier protein] reductase
VHVVVNGRDAATLEDTRRRLSAAHDVEVVAVAGDVTDAATQGSLLAVCPAPDIMVINNAGPAPRTFAATTAADWRDGLERNMLAQLALVHAVIGGMRERRFGRIVSITSAMVTTPRPHMVLSSGARAGLTAVLKGLSLEVAADNVTINSLLPERIDTDRQEFMARRAMERDGISYEEARAAQVRSIAAGRLGRPEEVGAACAFLCSVHAGFISGNNLHLDGGSYPALI